MGGGGGRGRAVDVWSCVSGLKGRDGSYVQGRESWEGFISGIFGWCDCSWLLMV